MTELTGRQAKILKDIIEEYIETGEPVGSQTLDRKYSLSVSPATIRHEMAELTKLGYLKQPHTSAGRIPTANGFKFFIAELMEEKKLSVTEEVSAREAVWDYRYEFDHLLREITKALAIRTRALAIATTTDGDLYASGYANILDMPEFYDIDVTKNVLSLLDEVKRLQLIFDQALGEDPIHVLLGEEFEQEYLRPCGVVFTRFEAGAKRGGTVGIIGPSRLDYPRVIPVVRYFGGLINEISQNW